MTLGSQLARRVWWHEEPQSAQAVILENSQWLFQRVFCGSPGNHLGRGLLLPREPSGRRMLGAHDTSRRMVPTRLTMEWKALELE